MIRYLVYALTVACLIISCYDTYFKCCISCKRPRSIPCVLLSSDAIVVLYNITSESEGSVEVCAVLEEGKSVAFNVVGFILRPDSASA